MSFRAPLSSCRLKGVSWHLVTKSRGGTEHVSNSPSGNVTLSHSIPTMSFSSGVGMMCSVPELPTCIPSFIALDSTVLARSGMYRRVIVPGWVILILTVGVVSLLVVPWISLWCWGSHAVSPSFSHKIFGVFSTD